MILGFTGTRRGMTQAQRAALADCVSALPARAVHGGAVGADEEFDAFLVRIGMPAWDIEVAGPLVRNRTIARSCDYLVAAPATTEEVVRSGTWMTVRRARKFGKPIIILLPDGGVREEKR